MTTMTLLGIYYLDADNATKREFAEERKYEELGTTSFSEGDSISPTSIIFSDYDDLIQAHFLEIKGNNIYFINRVGNNEERLTLKNPTLFVCRSPVDSGQIYIDEKDLGYFSFLEPEVLNRELYRNEAIAIAVDRKANKESVVIFVISDKCPD